MTLSPQEENHIRNLSLIPFAIVFYIFLGYFVYLIHINATLDLSFVLEYFMSIFLVVFPVMFFGTEQVLRSRKEKRQLRFYAKRFAGSISLFALGGIIFWGVWFVTGLSLSSIVDSSMLLVITYAVWISIWGFIVFRFRKEFDTLSKGDW